MISKKFQSDPINFPSHYISRWLPWGLILGDFRRDAADLPLGFRSSSARDAAGIFLEILRCPQIHGQQKTESF